MINTATNTVVRTINLGLPIAVPGQSSAYGAAPNSIAVDNKNGIAYVALYNANAVAVVNLANGVTNAVEGMSPVAYARFSVVFDAAANVLIVANDKGIGARDSYECDHGVCGYNTHQDNGTVSIVPVPNSATLATMTSDVYAYNHWNRTPNIESASGGNPHAKPVVIPVRIGDPSLIKHVFLIVRENRTYDQGPGRRGCRQWRGLAGRVRRRLRGRRCSDHAERTRAGDLAFLYWITSTTRAGSRLTATSGSPKAWRPMPMTSSLRIGIAAIPAETPA